MFQALIEKHFPVPNSSGNFEFGNDSPKTSVQVGKKRKGGNFGKSRSEKKFKKEDLFGHGGCKYGMMLIPYHFETVLSGVLVRFISY